MKYIFGPVYSRRFGISLGIDLSPDRKRCNFDCLYCELDRSKPVDTYNNPPDPEEIVKQLKDFLDKHNYPDVITVTSNGEPTLYPYLDQLIDLINEIKGPSKTLILSNGSTIHNEKIRNALKKLDKVKISLDAVDEKIFKKVDRPHKNIHIDEIVEGLKLFRKEYSGELVIEILIVKYINDSPESIEQIKKVLEEIKPDRVDIGTVDRPPAYRVFPVSNEKLYEIADILKEFNVHVVERKYSQTFQYDLTEEEILRMLKTRPLTEEDIKNTFSYETVKKFEKLLKKGKIRYKNVENNTFYFC